MPGTKIATCCYCGTRAALVLRGPERHELSCSACGAPLHDLKMLRADHAGDRGRGRSAPSRKPVLHASERVRPHPPRRRRKARKSLGRRILEEAWDVVEDIFD